MPNFSSAFLAAAGFLTASASIQSLWSTSTTPAYSTTANPGEFGLKFQVSQAGQIQGIRFYKGSGNTGTHTGHLWDSSGHLLASVTFTNETAGGWQTAYFSPVSIQPNTIYVISYYSPNGGYSYTLNYFNSAYTSGSITAPSSSQANGNGVVTWGSSSAFPTKSTEQPNYWVDVLFATQSGGTAAERIDALRIAAEFVIVLPRANA